mmetsp:Transcript_2407/g.6198  ORF Transcript_2407/g.6198 Transcript_2407/m.6198 type:complete len:281 (-) Transcript_2407:763-1605(-)
MRANRRDVHSFNHLVGLLHDPSQSCRLLLLRLRRVRWLQLLGRLQRLLAQRQVLRMLGQQLLEQCRMLFLRRPFAQALQVLDLRIPHGLRQLLGVGAGVLGLGLLRLLLLRFGSRDRILHGEAATRKLAGGLARRLPEGGEAEQHVAGLHGVGQLLVHGHGEEDRRPRATTHLLRAELLLARDRAVEAGVCLHRNGLRQRPVQGQRHAFQALQQRDVVMPDLHPGNMLALLQLQRLWPSVGGAHQSLGAVVDHDKLRLEERVVEFVVQQQGLRRGLTILV